MTLRNRNSLAFEHLAGGTRRALVQGNQYRSAFRRSPQRTVSLRRLKMKARCASLLAVLLVAGALQAMAASLITKAQAEKDALAAVGGGTVTLAVSTPTSARRRGRLTLPGGPTNTKCGSMPTRERFSRSSRNLSRVGARLGKSCNPRCQAKRASHRSPPKRAPRTRSRPPPAPGFFLHPSELGFFL